MTDTSFVWTCSTSSAMSAGQKAHALGDELRSIAAFFEANPELAARTYDVCVNSVQVHVRTRDDLVELARALKTATGRCDKTEMGTYFRVSGSFGRLYVWGVVDREQVCRKIVRGVRQVPEQTIPAHEVEDVIWECEPLLAEASS